MNLIPGEEARQTLGNGMLFAQREIFNMNNPHLLSLYQLTNQSSP